MNKTLEGKLIRLRALEPEDVDLLYEWENDASVWHLSTTLAPYSKHLLRQFARAENDIYANKQLRLMICLKDKRPIGAIDLFDFSPHHRRAGIGILIANKKDRNNGCGSEALDLLIDYAFGTLQLHQLFCNILTDNQESIALFQKKGFIISGTKKQWININNSWRDEHTLQLIANNELS